MHGEPHSGGDVSVEWSQNFNPNDKTNLAPYRLVHFIVLAFFINRFLPRDWPGLQWPVFRPLIKCGQQSLEVFCVGVFLAVGAHVALVEVSGAIWMQIVVSVVGIALMTAVAITAPGPRARTRSNRWPRRRPRQVAENSQPKPSLALHQTLGSARFHVRKEFVSLPPDFMGEAVLR